MCEWNLSHQIQLHWWLIDKGNDADCIQEFKEKGWRISKADWRTSGHLEVGIYLHSLPYIMIIVDHSYNLKVFFEPNQWVPPFVIQPASRLVSTCCLFGLHTAVSSSKAICKKKRLKISNYLNQCQYKNIIVHIFAKFWIR